MARDNGGIYTDTQDGRDPIPGEPLPVPPEDD